MSLSPLDQALDRSERALLRIERSLGDRSAAAGRDPALRSKVKAVVAELDDIIRQAGSQR